MPGQPLRSLDPVNTFSVVVPTTTETSLVTLENVNSPDNDSEMVIWGIVTITPGTGTTSVTVNVYQVYAPTNKQVLQNYVVPATAGVKLNIPFYASDTFDPEVAGMSFELTVSQAGATANGTVNYATMSGLIN